MSLPTLVISWLFDDCHSNRCEMSVDPHVRMQIVKNPQNEFKVSRVSESGRQDPPQGESIFSYALASGEGASAILPAALHNSRQWKAGHDWVLTLTEWTKARCTCSYQMRPCFLGPLVTETISLPVGDSKTTWTLALNKGNLPFTKSPSILTQK